MEIIRKATGKRRWSMVVWGGGKHKPVPVIR